MSKKCAPLWRAAHSHFEVKMANGNQQQQQQQKQQKQPQHHLQQLQQLQQLQLQHCNYININFSYSFN